MMEERKMELKLQRIDLMKEIEKYNEKAELLGLEKIIVGETINTSTPKSTISTTSPADRYNNMFANKHYEYRADIRNALSKLGFKDALYYETGRHTTEDVMFIIGEGKETVDGYSRTYYYATFS